ncbi:unnamed protein product [Vitrella brassicaformis CCMP3155]|uniref:Protein kinase domain-containing protein n=1 Tax=Vitrella brassicaformis (strain CCMP3155) TaxID=1169540 RepID=A0A0G4FTS4_VITBC|nr:unnamed protein product [Vitrella brassicaformis CCMP3155]|eukprot:CEM18351.1 unnamed protein product [Vitrella brassicaformis CCMP3155]
MKMLNVLYEATEAADGKVKVIDFDPAHLEDLPHQPFEEHLRRHTNLHRRVLTRTRWEPINAITVSGAFMQSPETFRFVYSEQTDLWQCGVIMPQRGECDEENHNMLVQHLAHGPHFPPEALERFPEACDLLRTLLTVVPDRRCKSAQHALKHKWFTGPWRCRIAHDYEDPNGSPNMPRVKEGDVVLVLRSERLGWSIGRKLIDGRDIPDEPTGHFPTGTIENPPL